MAEVMSIGDFSTDALGVLQSDAESESIPNLNSRRINEVNGGTPLRVDEECIDGECVSSLDALRSFLERPNLLANTLNEKPYDGTTVGDCVAWSSRIISRSCSLFNFKPMNVWRDGNIIYIEEKQQGRGHKHRTFGTPMPKYERLGHVTERKLTEETDDFPEIFPCRPFTYRVFERKISPNCRLIISKEIDSIYEGNATEIKSVNGFTGLDRYRFLGVQKKLTVAMLTGMKQYCFATRDTNDVHITRVQFIEDITRFDTVGHIECWQKWIVRLCSKLAALSPSRLQRESEAVLSFDKKHAFLSGDFLLTLPFFPKFQNPKEGARICTPDELHTIVYDGDRKIPQSLSISRAHVISMDTFRKARVNGDLVVAGLIRFPLKKVLFLTNQETFESILHSINDSDDVIWRFYDESTEIPSGF